MVWSAPIMANNLKNKVTLKVRLFRRLSEVLLRRFVASPVKSVMPSTSSLCKCRIIILNNHKYSSFFLRGYEVFVQASLRLFPWRRLNRRHHCVHRKPCRQLPHILHTSHTQCVNVQPHTRYTRHDKNPNILWKDFVC